MDSIRKERLEDRMKRRKKKKVLSFKFTRKELLNSLEYCKKSPKQDKTKDKCISRRLSKREMKGHAALSYTRMAMELRECVLRNQWSDAVSLMLMFIDGPKTNQPLVWQYCFKILLNHPSGGEEVLEEFIRMTTGSSEPRELIQSLSDLLQLSMSKSG